MWSLDPSCLGEDSYNRDIPPVCEYGPGGVGSDYIMSALPTYLAVIPSFCLSLWKFFSASLRGFLKHNCSVNSGNVGVSLGGGEFRVFLLCHFGHILFYDIFITEKPDKHEEVKTTQHPPTQRQLLSQRFTSSSLHVYTLKTMKLTAFFVRCFLACFHFCIPTYSLKEIIFKDSFCIYCSMLSLWVVKSN